MATVFDRLAAALQPVTMAAAKLVEPLGPLAAGLSAVAAASAAVVDPLGVVTARLAPLDLDDVGYGNSHIHRKLAQLLLSPFVLPFWTWTSCDVGIPTSPARASTNSLVPWLSQYWAHFFPAALHMAVASKYPSPARCRTGPIGDTDPLARDPSAEPHG